jgi:hypothetical protein
MLFLPYLQLSTPIRIVFCGTAAGTFGAHGILPILLEIWISILVIIEAKPFFDKVDVNATWVTFGF